MRISLLNTLTTATVIGSAAVGGLFFAFSTLVMRGLNRIEPAAAITAMRGINAEAQRSTPFLLLFFGSALAALAVGIAATVQLRRRGSGYLLAGAILAIVAMLVTAAVNVPLNNQLDNADLTANAALVWQSYARPWTAWNHARTLCPLIGAVLLTAGMLRRRQ